MKYLPVAAYLMAVVLGDLAIANECVDDLEIQGKDPQTLYIHYFFRTRPNDKIPKGGGRYPDFPPSTIASFRVEVGDSFDLFYNKPSRYSGEIRRDADSYQAVLDCIFVPGIQFKGKVALDEIFAPRYTQELKPIAADIRIVFSRSKNVQTFLKLQAKIDAGEVVDTGATEASHQSVKDKSALLANESKPASTSSDKSKPLYLQYIRPPLDISGNISPAQHLMTIKIHIGKPAEVVGWFSSRVLRQGDRYHVAIKGRYHFSGKADLEEVFVLKLPAEVPSGPNSCLAVLSKSSEFEPFLKAAAERAPVKMRMGNPVERGERFSPTPEARAK